MPTGSSAVLAPLVEAGYDPHGDDAAIGWAGGTSMAMTLVAQLNPPKAYVITWAQTQTGVTTRTNG